MIRRAWAILRHALTGHPIPPTPDDIDRWARGAAINAHQPYEPERIQAGGQVIASRRTPQAREPAPERACIAPGNHGALCICKFDGKPLPPPPPHGDGGEAWDCHCPAPCHGVCCGCRCHG